MKLYVVRHGETEYNAHGRFAGSTDVPLNGVGYTQAGQLAEKLSEISFDRIVTSPMLRARQTADIINRGRSLPLAVMDGFAERNMGVYEGLTRSEAKERYPQTWARMSSKGLDEGPDGGETIRQCEERVCFALKELIHASGSKTVLLVCHGFVARLINRHFLQLDDDEMHSFSLDNCEVADYES